MSLRDSVEKANRSLEDTLALSRQVISDIQNRLTESEKKSIEYFWNSKKKVIREIIPESIIFFFENETLDEYLHDNTFRRVKHDMEGLVTKKYVVKVEDDKSAIHYALTNKGTAFLKDKHPSYITLFAKILESTPNIIKLFVGLIGLVASIFGIIQFVHDVILKK